MPRIWPRRSRFTPPASPVNNCSGRSRGTTRPTAPPCSSRRRPARRSTRPMPSAGSTSGRSAIRVEGSSTPPAAWRSSTRGARYAIPPTRRSWRSSTATPSATRGAATTISPSGRSTTCSAIIHRGGATSSASGQTRRSIHIIAGRAAWSTATSTPRATTATSFTARSSAARRVPATPTTSTRGPTTSATRSPSTTTPPSRGRWRGSSRSMAGRRWRRCRRRRFPPTSFSSRRR